MLGVIGGVVALIAAVGVTGAGVVFTRCSMNDLDEVSIGQNSFVYAADGSLLGSIPAEKNRQPVSLAGVSPWMPKAVVAIEDKRFYEHGGVDYVGIVRAAIADIRARKAVQGASTITQQLVRNLYKNVSSERTVDRKLKEVCLARKLDLAWSKSRILTSYMNQVFYGNRAYGIEAAAQTYFSESASELTLEQAALLAGLPQAPSEYDPFHNPKGAITRRNEVLRAMLETGDITRFEYDQASVRPLRLKAGRIYTAIKEPYFFSYVRNELIEQYGAQTVRSGGLKVYTTIDRRLQRLANKAIRDTLSYKDDPAAAVIAIDPRSGGIRAMTAVTPGQKNNQFNLVAQSRRQAGSTFKTYVLAAAVEKGMNPYDTYYTSAPFHYQPDPYSPAWDVHTYSYSYSGSMSVASATLASDNTIFAQLTLDTGPENVADMAYRLGVRQSELPVVPSLGLGSAAVSPLEMASAYATLAAGGVYSHPMAIRKVVLPDGTTDTSAGWGKPVRERVTPDWVAYEVTRVLEQNMLSGTGTGAYFGRIAAGKTGTTDDHADGWFCGYTPRLAAAVWIGYPGGEIPMNSVHGVAIAGGNLPASIWHLFMQPALENTKEIDFPPPRTPSRFVQWGHGQYANSWLGSDTTTTAETTTTTARTTTKAKPPSKPEPPPVTTIAPPPETTVTEPPVTEPPVTEPPPTIPTSTGP